MATRSAFERLHAFEAKKRNCMHGGAFKLAAANSKGSYTSVCFLNGEGKYLGNG